MFAVVRNPDIAELGVIPATALDMHRGKGWFRVSDFRPQPADFYLPDFAESTQDLDAPESSSPAKPEQSEERKA